MGIIGDLLSYREGSKFHVKLVLPCQELSAIFLALEKYWQLVEELYTEPKNEEILGSFLHAIVTDQRPPPAKKNTKIKKAAPSNLPEHKDITSFFGNAATRQVKALRKILKNLRLFAFTEINFYFRV